ncbi:uncharacterized protein ARMOST_18326 [Armillaria ostoyae]|uniref:Uncharacterized protein n=1 Tax=Armillaria ostoyae TaxID=47428 RepID=A0A284S1G1_ARMOS|nr:uncharacterized protein ARMOST_18326 [Armillaria ostoyae]
MSSVLAYDGELPVLHSPLWAPWMAYTLAFTVRGRHDASNRASFSMPTIAVTPPARHQAPRITIHDDLQYKIDIYSPRLLCARGLNTPTLSQKYTPHRRPPTLVALDPKCRTPALSYPSTSSPCLPVPPAYAQYADSEEEVLV